MVPPAQPAAATIPPQGGKGNGNNQIKKLAHDQDVASFAHAEMLEAIPALIQS